MTTIPQSLRELIAGGPLAHLVTLEPDGRPQVTVIWIGLDGDEIVSGHMNLSRKLRNVQRDPRVSISFEAPRTPGTVLAEHAVLRGHARVTEGGAHDLLTRLGKVYVGGDFAFPTPEDLPSDGSAGYVLRTSIERITGVGPWADAGG
jgi:PPOX class probable F420-dependent enzyme